MGYVRVPIFALAMVATIGACTKRDPVDDKAARNAVALPAVNEPAPSAMGEPHGNATAPATLVPVPAAKIPAALQGRWGLTPADCMPGRADAKGLLVISAGDLRFYESRAVPAGNIAADADSISGDFAFTGEGQSWTKYQSLQLQKQGLVRTETKPTASFTYAKCT
jgi:hypothetical protein